MRHFLAAIAAILALGATPALAQKTRIEVPANASWKHAATGIVLRSTIAGMARGEVTDSSAAELDVMIQYATADESTFVTAYVFRPALASVPVRFDRSETQILLRDIYGGAQPRGAPVAFAPPRASTPSGLRRIYAPGKPPYRSTGLALMPLGDWLVAVRISSSTLDPSQLDARLDETIAAIGWPEGVADSPAAVPVAACARPLAYAKRARLRQASMIDALLGATIAGMAADAADKSDAASTRAVLCRDLPPKLEYGVYRASDSSASYVMALGDAGRIISAYPSLGGLAGGSKGFALSFGELDGTLVYPTFDKLAHPDRALEAVMKTAPMSRSARGGKEITIGTGAN